GQHDAEDERRGHALPPLAERADAREGGVDRPELDHVEAALVPGEIALQNRESDEETGHAGVLFTRSGTTAWGLRARRSPWRTGRRGRTPRGRPRSVVGAGGSAWPRGRRTPCSRGV